MEDSRFFEVKSLKKKDLPFHLHWFYDEDYFGEELLGLKAQEIEALKQVAADGFELLQKATDKFIASNNLKFLGVPREFEDVIVKTWQERQKHPFLYGRFDINGLLADQKFKIIEFNADTCSTLPETIHWQKIQLDQMGSSGRQFNNVAADLRETFGQIRANIKFDEAFILASSFGHQEDKLNCSAVLEQAAASGFSPFYTNLENVTFDENEGVFYEVGSEFQPVDVLFKMFPWDWLFFEEKQLGRILSKIILNDQCLVLNPPYSFIWQNKKFMAYITENFPNQIFAETYLRPPVSSAYVEKPILGRTGENVRIFLDKTYETKGDFASQERVYQQYYPLETDSEGYSYQIGMFQTKKPSAINARANNNKIITDDSEFISHYIN